MLQISVSCLSLTWLRSGDKNIANVNKTIVSIPDTGGTEAVSNNHLLYKHHVCVNGRAFANL